MLQTQVQHGEFELSVSGNILVAHLIGGWNKEAALAFDREFRIVAEPLLTESWGHLVFLDDWSLGVPKTIPIIEDLVHWCVANDLKRAAHVYSPSMLKEMQANDMVIEQHGEFQRRSFSEQGQAITWLSDAGFTLKR